MRSISSFMRYVRTHRTSLLLGLGVVILLAITMIGINYYVIGRYERFIYSSATIPSNSKVVGVVFGGGIYHNKPLPILKKRLDAGAKLLQSGNVRKLIVSGDNRFTDYNEPQAMKDYLVQEKGVDPALIQLDNAGRSTYETCERAVKVFGLNHAILISDATHLPRAIYTCRSFGMEAFGYASDITTSDALLSQRLREVLARTKATINIYLIGEKTILGNRIKV